MDILLKDYVGKEVVSAGEIYDNTVSNINNRLVRIDWAEGTKVSVYPKVLRGGQIIINMHFPSGSAANLAETIKLFSELMATLTFPTEELEVLKRTVVASF